MGRAPWSAQVDAGKEKKEAVTAAAELQHNHSPSTVGRWTTTWARTRQRRGASEAGELGCKDEEARGGRRRLRKGGETQG